MLPFIPEPTSELKARYPKAIERGWLGDAEQSDRPGKHRENVFDFICGTRLIVSRDLINGKSKIHFSGSCAAEWCLDKQPEHIMQHMCNLMNLISGATKMKFIKMSEGGIPHWAVIE